MLESRNWTEWSSGSPRHVSPLAQALITFFYGLGIGANACALALLRTARNRKQSLMMRCLACSDLLALLGSLALMYAQLYARVGNRRWFCALRVVLRSFGLSSGCVATVMAAERWMALTRPFLYHKHVTYALIVRAILSLWLVTLLLVCLPLAGFGLYHTPQLGCVRYREARDPHGIAYAFLMFTFGCLLCGLIVACNLAVVRALCRMGRESGAHRTTVRKESRELAFDSATPDELSFARLMLVLCLFFVACWVPQMVTIVMAQVREGKHPFYRIADICMALNFTLDPVIYVLSRRPHRRSLRDLLKPLCHSCWSGHTLRKPSALVKSSQDGSKRTKEVNQNSFSSSSSHNEGIPMEKIKISVQHHQSAGHDKPRDIISNNETDTL